MLRRALTAVLLLLLVPLSAMATLYDDLAELSRATATGLQSYDVALRFTLVTTQGDQADTSHIDLEAAGHWPDRLKVHQSTPGSEAHLGTGPQGAWFHVTQLEACYRGEAAVLDRAPERAGNMDFMATGRFSFLAGLVPALLPAGVPMEAAGDTVLTVGGRKVTCRVLTVAAAPPSGDPTRPRPGIQVFCVDPQTGLVLGSSTELTVRQGNQDVRRVAVLTMKRLETEAPADAVFAYTPPAGVRVVDHPDRLTNPEALTGLPAPDVVFRDLDGKEIRVADYRGKVLFLDVWATWCPPCRKEMPHIQTLYKELAGDRLAILAVSSEPVATIRSFLADKPYTFPIGQVSDRDAATKLKATSIPTGLVIDAAGVVRAHLVGAQTEAQLRAALARAGLED